MAENYEAMNNDGNIKISDEVISTIAAVAVSEIEGANTMGGAFGGLVEKFSKKNYTKGIKVMSNDGQITIDVNIIVDFGVKIHEVAWNVQNNVKKSVELMSGLEVDKVNIHVVGVEQQKAENEASNENDNIQPEQEQE